MLNDRTIRLTGETFGRLQRFGYGFKGHELGTPDKVIAKLLDTIDGDGIGLLLAGLEVGSIRELKELVDRGRKMDVVRVQALAMRDHLEDVRAMNQRARMISAIPHVNAARAHLKTIELELGLRAIGSVLVDDDANAVAVFHPRRDATAAELADELDGVLESLANGDLDATETTRHLAKAELDYRRSRAAR